MSKIDNFIKKINRNKNNVMPVPPPDIEADGHYNKTDTPIFEWGAIYFGHIFNSMVECFLEDKAFELIMNYDPKGDGVVYTFEKKDSRFTDTA